MRTAPPGILRNTVMSGGTNLISWFDRYDTTVINGSTQGNISLAYSNPNLSITTFDGNIGGGGPSVSIAGLFPELVTATQVSTGTTAITQNTLCLTQSVGSGDGGSIIDMEPIPFNLDPTQPDPFQLSATSVFANTGGANLFANLYLPINISVDHTCSLSDIIVTINSDESIVIEMIDTVGPLNKHITINGKTFIGTNPTVSYGASQYFMVLGNTNDPPGSIIIVAAFPIIPSPIVIPLVCAPCGLKARQGR